MMKKSLIQPAILTAVVFCLFAAVGPKMVDAQDDLQAASAAIRAQKRLYIEKAMELTPQEEKAFWRLYEEYETGLTKIRGTRIELATGFLATHGNLSDAEALDMLYQKLRIDSDELSYKQSYVDKYKQILPGRKVVRFYQIENRFDTAAISELYRNIPVIR